MYITRPSLKVGRYKMIKHKLDHGNEVNPKRYRRFIKSTQIPGQVALVVPMTSREQHQIC